MGSRRLPGKSMLPLWGGMPVIEVVLRRVMAAKSLREVVLLTTSAPEDDALVGVAERLGVAVFRGPQEDVLARFAGGLAAHPADAIVRICADNPFVEPSAIDELVALFARIQPCDYASNHTPRSGLPDGIGAEVVAAPALRRAAAQARTSFEREHVTPFILSHREQFSISFAPAPTRSWPSVRLDIDTGDDYDSLRALAELLPEAGAPLWDRAAILLAWSFLSSQPPRGDGSGSQRDRRPIGAA
jgi:spore coat polysaccharide biosynthesis protein SpsF